MTEAIVDELSLIAPSDTQPWTEEESALLETRLYLLLQCQFKRKTQGDSTSLRVEDAAELMESIRFTLFLHMQAHGLPLRALISENMASLFAAAQATVSLYFEETRRLYSEACQTVCTLGGRSLRDTLTGMGAFFTRYDARLAAHQIPCDIDYQLCHPVADTLRGVSYLREYLRRLLIENELITRFDQERVVSLLQRGCPEYRELLVNLYEPVAACVLGHALLGGGETLLRLLPEDGHRIYAMLAACPPAQARTLLCNAAQTACGRLGAGNPFAIRYLVDAADALYPRITASPESVRGVFSLG